MKTKGAIPQSIHPIENRPASPRWILSLVAMAFGLMTLKEGGSVLFLDGAARAAAGAYVPFVLWFNFLAGFAYVAAGIGFLRGSRWSVGLAFGIFLGTAAVFAALGLHILFGGAFENRTLVAMTIRTTVWLALAFGARRFLGPSRRVP